MGSSWQRPSVPTSSWTSGVAIAGHDRGLRLKVGAIGTVGRDQSGGLDSILQSFSKGYIYPHYGGD
jgi:hypothetical protein